MRHRKPDIVPDARTAGAPGRNDVLDPLDAGGTREDGARPASRPRAMTWVVVADSARARIFTLHWAGPPLQEQKEILHPQSRAHERDLRSDKPGRAFDSVGPGRHALIKAVSPKETEAQRLSIQLAHEIEVARARGDFQSLILAAAPSFLGDLRSRLSDTTTRMIAAEVDKELVHMEPDEIAAHLPPDLVPPQKRPTIMTPRPRREIRPQKRKRMAATRLRQESGAARRLPPACFLPPP